jgi:hypothetical protein
MILDHPKIIAAIRELENTVTTSGEKLKLHRLCKIRYAGEALRALLGPPVASNSGQQSLDIENSDLPRSKRMALRALWESMDDWLWYVAAAENPGKWRDFLTDVMDELEKGNDENRVRGKAGRRGYPLEALTYALKLREKNPEMTASKLRRKCLKEFSEDDLPPDGDAFRRWLNRPLKNRAN